MFENCLPLTDFYITEITDNHSNNKPVTQLFNIYTFPDK